MRPKRIILIRHGESEGNVNPEIHRTKPDSKLSLTKSGRQQALSAGTALKKILGDETVHYYLSPYRRSRETLQHMLRGLQAGRIFEDPRLREQDWGHFRGKSETAIIQKERYKYGTFYFRFPDGESGADVFDRVSTFLETIHRDFVSTSYADNAVIVTHGLTIRLFLMRWFHKTVEEFETWGNPNNCEFFVMNKIDSRYVMPVLRSAR